MHFFLHGGSEYIRKKKFSFLSFCQNMTVNNLLDCSKLFKLHDLIMKLELTLLAL